MATGRLRLGTSARLPILPRHPDTLIQSEFTGIDKGGKAYFFCRILPASITVW